MTFEMYGKLTAYNVLTGGPGLPMINTMLYSLMTDQGIKPHVDILTLSQTKEIYRIKEILDSPDDERFKSVIDKHADWIIDQGLLHTKTKLEKKDKIATYLLKNILYYRYTLMYFTGV
ncbi:uncharacterized protein LOC123546542 [Mercenaria mercenaria]|uniref:uncharacterized protein LOC123546542 n=1 Tax=Mercenaria mercenaria TaxID=6596 RepID=UPI00234F353B|nr:uncharacterized protein LOC123546542 [Mercenaria mercenaria]